MHPRYQIQKLQNLQLTAPRETIKTSAAMGCE